MNSAETQARAIEDAIARMQARRTQDFARLKWYSASILCKLFVLLQIFTLAVLPFGTYMKLEAHSLAIDPPKSINAIWLETSGACLSYGVGLLVGVLAVRHCRTKLESVGG
jgi:hypothetical protein